jgi:hypothetical protein
MNVGSPARKSIRRPVTLISAANGEPPIEVTPRQIAIGKMIAAAFGAVAIAIPLLAFPSNTGAAIDARPEVVAPPEPGAEEVARVKAEAEADAKGKAGTFYTSCTYTPSGTEHYRELSYRKGKVRESSSTKCFSRQVP